MSSLVEGFQRWKVQILRCYESMQFYKNPSDLAHARVLVSVVGHGLPERDCMTIDNDGLVNVDGADTRISDRLQPPSDLNCPTCVVHVDADSRNTYNDRGGESVDSIRA